MLNQVNYYLHQKYHQLHSLLSYTFCMRNYTFRDNLKRLQMLKNIHKGKRCFIIGNGPSLRETDLSLINGEFSFGLNRIYLLFDKLGFATTYFVVMNRLVLEQFAGEISLSVPSPKFTSWENRAFTSSIHNMYYFFRHNGAGFYQDLTKGIWGGATVTYTAMQIAYYMGFQKVILVGVDHSFQTEGKAHTTITSTGDDHNHFDPSYFGKGIRWQLPDLVTSEHAYRLAYKNYSQAGREIVDATIRGKLTVFPKADYYSLF